MLMLLDELVSSKQSDKTQYRSILYEKQVSNFHFRRVSKIQYV